MFGPDDLDVKQIWLKSLTVVVVLVVDAVVVILMVVMNMVFVMIVVVVVVVVNIIVIIFVTTIELVDRFGGSGFWFSATTGVLLVWFKLAPPA